VRRATHTNPATRLRRAVVVLGAALVLAACGSPARGLLTSADIPSNLGVQANAAFSASQESQLSSTAHCKRAGEVVFNVPGKGVQPGSLLTAAKAPEIVNVYTSCDSTGHAHAAFAAAVKDLGGTSVPRIGDEAKLLDLSNSGERAYFVEWRQNTQVGLLLVAGAPGDARITSGLAETLARRAVARS